MESYLKALEPDIWNAMINDYIPLKRIRTLAQKKSKKSNSMAMDTILDGLPDDVKENIGECNSSKELWDKIKDLYSDEAYQLEQSLVYNKSSDEDSFEEELDIETKFNLEAKLECALYELGKYKQKCKQLKDLISEQRKCNTPILTPFSFK